MVGCEGPGRVGGGRAGGGAGIVVVVAGGVGVIGEVEPVTGPVFAVAGGIEKSRDLRVPSCRGGIGEKRVQFVDGGRQAGEVVAESGEEASSVCGFR